MAKEAIIYSKQGENLVNLTDVKRVGDQIVMQGKLMGAWESTMYVPPESVVSTMRLFAKRQLLWYMICLPFFLRKRRKEKEKHN